MAAMSHWVANRVDGFFVYGGFYDPQFDPATQVLVDFPDTDPHPNPRTERWDGALGKRAATAVEIASFDAAQLTIRIDSEVTKAITAMGAALLKRILGTNPSAQQVRDLVADAKAAYRQLP